MSYKIHDKFAVKAKEKGYRARSVFKLVDLQKKFGMLKPGQKVLDLGSAPGSWLQGASELVGQKGFVVGVDLSDIEDLDLPNVRTFQMDILCEEFIPFLKERGFVPFEVVLSDAAPLTTGMKARDQGLSHELASGVLRVAVQVLKANGSLVVKIFEGNETPSLLKEAKKHFSKVQTFKPVASQKESKEIFLVARNFHN
ncbi:MAG: hypothetical protein A2748_01695 [Candidatus Wildermuthbacteria bacterium RIFCSPHIGHO2_01_FULL_45_20]|uniref:Ribosomal RNA large subunit methyltransferase E n=1 Tax=Candidatus Wildermuthbacteria bacterium RIFCSPHIGHO2_02_FULL_45_25 TaxID=1802450 RepID=A0A1G2R514_9BACT|nr:MAG: hypothetical protein A2748_01695 [Candidatus Wildermuthbacteria bacterium RIFCSPHIGHO2_01_FULL_45_20]OHA67817.1 MAG: hypothetical protein A3C04_04220 [Candidatus Wildermuthbacteria bacterium RIFCSPHIGHO2_02_FULL_45_25]